jgi:hypothetical protein
VAVTVKQNPENEVPAEVLAEAIVQVADAAKRLLSSRLTKRAILVLLHDSSGVGMRDIEYVLDHAAQLAFVYIKQPKKP